LNKIPHIIAVSEGFSAVFYFKAIIVVCLVRGSNGDIIKPFNEPAKPIVALKDVFA
jgi:hypothetical protein